MYNGFIRDNTRNTNESADVYTAHTGAGAFSLLGGYIDALASSGVIVMPQGGNAGRRSHPVRQQYHSRHGKPSARITRNLQR
jgi:hypothetical protein